jgi:hypothetical protein
MHESTGNMPGKANDTIEVDESGWFSKTTLGGGKGAKSCKCRAGSEGEGAKDWKRLEIM